MQVKQNYTSYYFPLLIIGILFFVFGFVTWVNSVLIAFFKEAFALTVLQANLVAFAFFIAYTCMAIPSSFFLRWVGFKRGMAIGLLFMAAGSLAFVPAANLSSYALFLTGLFAIGIGLTILQTAVNPFVTALGVQERAAQRFSFMGLANKLGGIVSQFLFGSLLLANTSGLVSGKAALQKAVQPYMQLSGLLAGLAVFILLLDLPDVSDEQEANWDDAAPSRKIWQFPNLVLGVVSLFCTVGCEVITADTIIVYGKMLGVGDEMQRFLNSLGIHLSASPAELPNYLTVLTLSGAMGTYILGMFLIPKIITQQKALRYGAILGFLLTVVAVSTSGFTSVLCIGLSGIAIAPMWPATWPLALNGLGHFSKLGSALLIMAISGGAILPLLHGFLSDKLNPTIAYAALLPCYAYIGYYAQAGHKKITW